MNIRHVLIPTDLSPEALRPCARVTSLARTLGARLTLLHVVPYVPSAAYDGLGLAPDFSIPDAAVELQEAQAELERQAAELDPELSVEVQVISAGRTAPAICDFAKEHGVDLIALSTHGRTGLRRLALGSTAEAVMRHSSVPVLAFPPESKPDA